MKAEIVPPPPVGYHLTNVHRWRAWTRRTKMPPEHWEFTLGKKCLRQLDEIGVDRHIKGAARREMKRRRWQVGDYYVRQEPVLETRKYIYVLDTPSQWAHRIFDSVNEAARALEMPFSEWQEVKVTRR